MIRRSHSLPEAINSLDLAVTNLVDALVRIGSLGTLRTDLSVYAYKRISTRIIKRLGK